MGSTEGVYSSTQQIGSFNQHRADTDQNAATYAKVNKQQSMGGGYISFGAPQSHAELALQIEALNYERFGILPPIPERTEASHPTVAKDVLSAKSGLGQKGYEDIDFGEAKEKPSKKFDAYDDIDLIETTSQTASANSESDYEIIAGVELAQPSPLPSEAKINSTSSEVNKLEKQLNAKYGGVSTALKEFAISLLQKASNFFAGLFHSKQSSEPQLTSTSQTFVPDTTESEYATVGEHLLANLRPDIVDRMASQQSIHADNDDYAVPADVIQPRATVLKNHLEQVAASSHQHTFNTDSETNEAIYTEVADTLTPEGIYETIPAELTTGLETKATTESSEGVKPLKVDAQFKKELEEKLREMGRTGRA